MSNDPFTVLKRVSQTTDADYRSIMSGLYLLCLDIAAIGILISIIMCGFRLATSKGAQVREECKRELLYKSIIGVIIFGFTFFVNIVYRISKEVV